MGPGVRAVRQTVLALLAALPGAACAQPPATSPAMATPMPLTRVAVDAAFSGYEQPVTLVVRDREVWQTTWAQVYRGRTPVPPLPPIDFAADMIVVAALGTKPTSGYAVEFTSASLANGIVTVEAVSASPGPRCATLQVITSPIDIARLPRRDGEVQFQFTPRVTAC